MSRSQSGGDCCPHCESPYNHGDVVDDCCAWASNARYRAAITEALESLRTGPLKDGYAASVLERALDA